MFSFSAWYALVLATPFTNLLCQEVTNPSSITINIDNSSGQSLNASASSCKCIKYFGKKLKECMQTLSEEEKKQNFLAMTMQAQIEYVKSLTFTEHVDFTAIFCDSNDILNPKDGPIQEAFFNHYLLLKKVVDRNMTLSPFNTYWCALFYFSIIPARECIPLEWLKMLEADYQLEKKNYFNSRNTL